MLGDILGRTGARNREQRELSTSMKESYERDVLFTINSIFKDGGVHSDEALERSMTCFAVGLEEDGTAAAYKGAGGELRSFMYVAASVCLRELEG